MMYGLYHNGRNPDVTRQRLRDSLDRVRTHRNEAPKRTIRRREYQVKAPLTMLHMDRLIK